MYDKFGGCPRYVFEKALSTEAEGEFQRAIDKSCLDIDKMFDALGKQGESDVIVHRLLHMIPFDNIPNINDALTPIKMTDSLAQKEETEEGNIGILMKYYQDHKYDFASPYTADLLLNQWASLKTQKFSDFIYCASDSALFSSVVSSYYENEAHKAFERGGVWACRPLGGDSGSGNDNEFKLEPQRLKTYRDYPTLTSLTSDNTTQSVYAKPTSKRWAAIDSLLLPITKKI